MNRIPARYRCKIAIDPVRGCWLWTGEINGGGYGRGWYKNVRYVAHRLIYWLAYGEQKFRLDDYSIELDHLCEVRNCVNPAHMEKVTRLINCKRIHRRRKRINSNGELKT